MEIARSLCIQPNFILLDEPFSGIDPIAVLELQKIIFDLKASGIGILITDHNVRETLSVTDRAYIIAEGRIFRAGTPHELGNDVEVRRDLPGRRILAELAAAAWIERGYRRLASEGSRRAVEAQALHAGYVDIARDWE